VSGAITASGVNAAVIPGSATFDWCLTCSIGGITGVSRIISIGTTTASAGSFAINTVSSDASVNTQPFVINATGLVGVGTTSPWAKLSIDAPAGVNSFAIGSSTATYFLVNSSGKVGVGTAAPTSPLHVIDNSGNGIVLQRTSATARKWNVLLLTNGALDFYDETAGADRLIIDTSGKVGIGVSPTYMLDLWSPSGTDARIGATTQSGVDNAQLLLTTNGQNTWTVTAKRSTNQFEITSAGGGGVYLSSGGTSWNSLSDLRLNPPFSRM
jgi:hypothetical protein